MSTGPVGSIEKESASPGGFSLSNGIREDQLVIQCETIQYIRNLIYSRITVDELGTMTFCLPEPAWKILSLLIERGARGTSVKVIHKEWNERRKEELPIEEPTVGGLT